jgi:hypothetical protein
MSDLLGIIIAGGGFLVVLPGIVVHMTFRPGTP